LSMIRDRRAPSGRRDSTASASFFVDAAPAHATIADSIWGVEGGTKGPRARGSQLDNSGMSTARVYDIDWVR
jgi:hypothetical protein